MEKRVTSLEVGKFETCRLLGISDQNCKRSRARAVTPSLCWLGCKAATNSKFLKAQSSALLQMITNNLLSKQKMLGEMTNYMSVLQLAERSFPLVPMPILHALLSSSTVM
jgi:hypothetical protein